MSEASGGFIGQEPSSSTSGNIAIRIPNGTPEKTFNGFTLNRIVRILRSGGIKGRVGPGTNNNLNTNGNSNNQQIMEQTNSQMVSTNIQSEQTQTGTANRSNSSKFASMVRQYITQRRVS